MLKKKGIRILGIILLIIGIIVFFVSALFKCIGCSKAYNLFIDSITFTGFILGVLGLIMLVISFIIKSKTNKHERKLK